MRDCTVVNDGSIDDYCKKNISIIDEIKSVYSTKVCSGKYFVSNKNFNKKLSKIRECMAQFENISVDIPRRISGFDGSFQIRKVLFGIRPHHLCRGSKIYGIMSSYAKDVLGRMEKPDNGKH